MVCKTLWPQMHVRLNGEPLEEADKYLGSQVAVDGGCERDWYTELMSIERGEC